MIVADWTNEQRTLRVHGLPGIKPETSIASLNEMRSIFTDTLNMAGVENFNGDPRVIPLQGNTLIEITFLGEYEDDKRNVLHAQVLAALSILFHHSGQVKDCFNWAQQDDESREAIVT
jgi:hypothetical protein